MPQTTRVIDEHYEMGNVLLEVYTFNYGEMQALERELKKHLNDVIIRHNGYRYDLERLYEDFDKVSSETDGVVSKDFNIIYHQNLDY